MDGQLFDSVTKLIAQGKTRRSVLKVLGGAITAGIFGTRLTGNALAGCGQCDGGQICYQGNCCSFGDDGDACTTVDDCCGDFCNDGVCNSCTTGTACDGECCIGFVCNQETFQCEPGVECSPVEGNCENSENCCGDLVCNGFSQCTESCAAERDSCETGADCCAGSFCLETGAGLACVSSESCLIAGDPCQNVDALVFTCCEGLTCVDAVCTEICIAAGESCADPVPAGGIAADCCDGSSCIDEVCVPDVTCAAEGDDCVADEDCCEGICCASVCHTIECCIDDILTGGNPNDRCPEGTTCFEGVCDPVNSGEETPAPETTVVLPNTGAGLVRAADDNRAEVAGILAGLGAAAIIVGKKLRP